MCINYYNNFEKNLTKFKRSYKKFNPDLMTSSLVTSLAKFFLIKNDIVISMTLMLFKFFNLFFDTEQIKL